MIRLIIGDSRYMILLVMIEHFFDREIDNEARFVLMRLKMSKDETGY